MLSVHSKYGKSQFDLHPSALPANMRSKLPRVKTDQALSHGNIEPGQAASPIALRGDSAHELSKALTPTSLKTVDTATHHHIALPESTILHEASSRVYARQSQISGICYRLVLLNRSGADRLPEYAKTLQGLHAALHDAKRKLCAEEAASIGAVRTYIRPVQTGNPSISDS